MIDSDDLFAVTDPEFEESIRIDRDIDAEDEALRRAARYERYLDSYHLTNASTEFLEDLCKHIYDDTPEPDERNHWLYGYYGSGKSHLLTALDLLFDTQSLEQEDMAAVWQRLDSQDDHAKLGADWQAIHEDLLVVPISINLLRYQSVRDQSFSEIILQEVYRQREFADRLDVAFFEEEFQQSNGLFDTRSVWDNRETLLNDILADAGVSDPDYTWSDVQQYRILSDIVLPGLTERATGMTDNLSDIQDRTIGQELAVSAIEAYRQELASQFDRPVKILLLMDEVTLFIGGNYQRLSELNALAESIADVGQGNIISVVTAQSNIEDVQPGLAVKQLNFGILKDRFPQQYELPSRHVGEIVQQRLLTKSRDGNSWIKNNALTASIHPQTMLTYQEVTQNTDPALDDISDKQFIAYYPLLPYQPALFMEILSNLRDRLADATKSIFSGTARAILSLVAGLRAEWAGKDGEKPIISLVDFYDLVQYELADIIPNKTRVIDDIKADASTTEFDLKVAKAVLLLSYVPDMVPQTDANIATAVIDDLAGQPRAQVRTQVRESLDGNLEKYIRPDTSTDGADLRIAEREEQQLINHAQELEADPDWDAIIAALDDHLWEQITAELGLPDAHEWTRNSDDTKYPVSYTFTLDDQPLDTAVDNETVFDVDVVIRGLKPEVEEDSIDPETLYWRLDTEGLAELQSQLEEWWALLTATQNINPPDSIERDRDDAARRVITKLASALSSGEFQVEADVFSSFDPALTEYIDEAYPDYFHPELSRIDTSHLDELRQLDDGDDLPAWARDIGVPTQSTTDFATFSDIAFELRKLVGTQVQESGDGVDVATVLERATAEDPLFAADGGTGPTPATLAVLWGLCRAGVFRVTTVDGEPVPLDELLMPQKHTTLTLSTVPINGRPKDVFVEHNIIEPTESGNQGYVNFDAWLGSLEERVRALAEDVEVQSETTFETDAVAPLVSSFAAQLRDIASDLADRQERAMTDDTDELETLIEATEADEAAIETAANRWTERLPFLLQLEGLARLNSTTIEWLSETTTTQLNALQDEIETAAEMAWWAEDGWGPLVSALESRYDAIDNLEQDWETQRTQTDLESLRLDLDGHPWLIPPLELPTQIVHDSFQTAYLDPLRQFRTAIEQIETVITALADQEPSDADEKPLTQALGQLNGGIEWAAVTASIVDRRRDQLATLDRVVGAAAPQELDGIGLLHGDETALRAQIEGLDTDDGVPDIVELDEGVVVK